jgi:hypothetical protein
MVDGYLVLMYTRVSRVPATTTKGYYCTIREKLDVAVLTEFIGRGTPITVTRFVLKFS